MSDKPATEHEIIFDEDNPEWTEQDFARAKPADQVFASAIAAQLVRKPGRPNQDKIQVTLRLDREVVERFRSGGPGWQTRMNAALRNAS